VVARTSGEEHLKLIGLDLETTGLQQEDGHRIIEIAMLTYDLNTRKMIGMYIERIDPERAIDPKAQAVHGIAYDDLVGCPKWDEVAPTIADYMSQGDLLIAHNMGFDGPFLAGELMRAGLEVPNISSFCTKEDARWACPDGKYPKLSELCWSLGVEYDQAKAHGAEYDVAVTMQCFFAALDRGFFKLPDSCKEIGEHENCYK
jgi:DNA polymerase-3 subunit epsilon